MKNNPIDFIFVGPSKTASTWIYHTLIEHPEIEIPKAKDTYYFTTEFWRGERWFHSLFKGEKKFLGEICHDYLIDQNALNKIKSYNDKIKIIVCVRDPLARSLSSYRFIKSNGLILPKDNVEKILKSYPQIKEESLYFKYIELLVEKFNLNQIYLCNYDTLKDNPQEFINGVTNFLQCSPMYLTDAQKKPVNLSRQYRIWIVSRLGKLCANLIRKAGYPNIVGVLKMNKVISSVFFKNFKNTNDFEIEKELVKKIEMSVASDWLKFKEKYGGMLN